MTGGGEGWGALGAPPPEPTAKELREQENEQCIGGMRGPAESVRKIPGWAKVGDLLRPSLCEAVEESKDLQRAFEEYTTEMDGKQWAEKFGPVLADVGAKVAGKMAEALGAPGVENTVGPTGWRHGLLGKMVEAAGDPETDVPSWLGGETPLGVSKEVQGRGVFPKAGPTDAQLASYEFLAGRTAWDVDSNYTSYMEHSEESRQELRRLVEEGHLERIGTWEQVVARWPGAIGTKIATLVKAKPDGTLKVRFAVDMRRSGVNGAAHCDERIVLPRALDAVQDILALWARAGPGEEVELLTVDIADAFLNLRIAEEERGFAVVRDAEGTYYAYRGVPFGLGTAPLTWGRTSALLTRAAQAMHHRDKHRAETYVDDPLLVVRGNEQERARRLLITLVFWSALGARLALHKLHRGTVVPWIGAELQITKGGVRVQLDKARTESLLAKVEEALGGRGLVKGLRSLAGELSWVAGLVPQVRPWVTMLWAAVTTMLSPAPPGTRQRPRGTVFMPMVERPLLWIRSFLRGERGGISRHHALRPLKQVQFHVRTDASTTGFGGILLSQEGVPLRYWHAELPPEVLSALGLPAGEPGHMTAYELLALLFSLIIWRRWLGSKAVATTAQLDNSSALKITAKLTWKEAICNRIAAEIALQVAWAQIYTFEHYRNTLNVEADALSRIGEGKEVPKRLRQVPRDSFPEAPLTSIAMQDWPRTEGLKKLKKKERRKRKEDAEGQGTSLELEGCTLAATSSDSLLPADLLLAAPSPQRLARSASWESAHAVRGALAVA